MNETHNGISHRGWSINTRSSNKIKHRLKYVAAMDDLGGMLDGSGSGFQQYRYYVIRYQTDKAFVDARSSIRAKPSGRYRRRRHRGKISGHPIYRDKDSAVDRIFGVHQARTRLGKMG